MATFLSRVGRWAYTNRFKTIAVWILVLIALGVGAAFLSKPTTESFSIPGIPSERAQNLMVERFPDKPKFGDDVSVTYVVATPKGASLTDPRYADAVQRMLDELKTVEKVKNPDKLINPLQVYGTQANPGPSVSS